MHAHRAHPEKPRSSALAVPASVQRALSARLKQFPRKEAPEPVGVEADPGALPAAARAMLREEYEQWLRAGLGLEQIDFEWLEPDFSGDGFRLRDRRTGRLYLFRPQGELQALGAPTEEIGGEQGRWLCELYRTWQALRGEQATVPVVADAAAVTSVAPPVPKPAEVIEAVNEVWETCDSPPEFSWAATSDALAETDSQSVPADASGSGAVAWSAEEGDVELQVAAEAAPLLHERKGGRSSRAGASHVEHRARPRHGGWKSHVLHVRVIVWRALRMVQWLWQREERGDHARLSMAPTPPAPVRRSRGARRVR